MVIESVTRTALGLVTPPKASLKTTSSWRGKWDGRREKSGRRWKIGAVISGDLSHDPLERGPCPSDGFQDLSRRVRAGEEAAAAKPVRRYEPAPCLFGPRCGVLWKVRAGQARYSAERDSPQGEWETVRLGPSGLSLPALSAA